MKKAESANFPEFEADMLKTWAAEKTFEQSLKLRQDSPRFSFYDGPPFANGLPHYGHVVAITEKDSITRYKTMRGYYVPRRNGWDTHGLPVEYELEKQLGISGKKQIQELGIAKFNEAAKASVFKYKEQWEEFMDRIGRWADTENSYATLDDNYIESVWWVISQLCEKDLVYRGFRSNPYCPRCATPLSNFEVNQNYKDDVIDPSVYVKFGLVNEPGTSFLAWTTTPWTLPANAALAVDPKADYVTVELRSDGDGWDKGEKLILAKARLGELELRQADYKVIKTEKGQALVGQRYQPLFPKVLKDWDEAALAPAHQIYADQSVSLEDGTGILHVAPRYGETDLALGQREGLPLLESVDSNGQMVPVLAAEPELAEIVGQFFKDADAHIVAVLTKRGHIFAAENFTHTYPFCWRCETPLLYFAQPSWFVKVTQLREALVKNNNQVNWVPEHIKQGRFGNWLAEARDWNFSRNRFWGAPLPIWVNVANAEDWLVVGSLAELRELSGQSGEFDLHRPGIDEVEIKKNGQTYRRVEEVFDCWFESGAMPYAQDHYPFAHKAEFQQAFPAEFIAEGLDQTRGWFYTLHVLGTALFDQPAFKNVIVNGLVLAADGKKLSKRLRNYPDPAELFNTVGADSLRFFLMSSPVVAGEDVRFSAAAVGEVNRNIFMTLWNVWSFFSTYAEIDDWKAPTKLIQPKSDNVLDQWLLARLNETVAEVTKQADDYQIARATRPLRDLIDDLSNWYVRRSRRRFWKSQNDGDKAQAYLTLHYTLMRICQLLAPWAPFVSDKLWRNLGQGMDEPVSVHLSDWPNAGKIDQGIINQMRTLREIVTEGLSARAAAGKKVRQPLSTFTASGYETLKPDLAVIVQDELNIKEFVQVKAKSPSIELNTEITHELKLEGLARELIRLIQSKRKEADLAVDDRIKLVLGIEEGDLLAAAQQFKDVIASETLATSLELQSTLGEAVPTVVVGEKVSVSLVKA